MMNLFEDVEAENYKFINVIDALELVGKKIDYGISDIARRLLLDKFNKIACMFKLNDYEEIELYCSEQAFNGDYEVTTEFLKLAISTDGTFDYTETNTYGIEDEYTKEHWFGYYWLKSDFFNFHLVKRIGISEEYYENILEADSKEALYDFIALQAEYEENETAKTDAKKVTIKFFKEVAEIESHQQPDKTITNSDTSDTATAEQKSKEICKAQSHIDLENLIKLNDDYISVFEVFEIIKNKTVLKLDRKIADLFIGFNFTKKSKPYNKVSYFNGQPIELFRDYQNKTLTEMDLLLIELGSGEICIESNDQRLHNFVWDKFDFFFEFKSITKIDLENEDVQDDVIQIQESTNFGQLSIQQTELNIENLNAEINQLRQLIIKKDKKIKELESSKISKDRSKLGTREETKKDYSDLTPEQEIPHTRQRGSVRKIIAVLVDMAKLPSEPFVAFNMLDAHAQSKGMELPSKDTTVKWTHKSS